MKRNTRRVIKHFTIIGISFIIAHDLIRVIFGNDDGFFLIAEDSIWKEPPFFILGLLLIGAMFCLGGHSVFNLFAYMVSAASDGKMIEEDPMETSEVVWNLTIGGIFDFLMGALDQSKDRELRRNVREASREYDRYMASSQHQYYENLRDKYKK